MEVSLLSKLFGSEASWQGPCTVILNADAGIQQLGNDSIGPSATKSYAPRLVSGRIIADAVCLLPGGEALLMVLQQKVRQPTGEDVLRQTITVVDPAHVVGVEFTDAAVLGSLGVTPPLIRTGSHSGITLRPGYEKT